MKLTKSLPVPQSDEDWWDFNDLISAGDWWSEWRFWQALRPQPQVIIIDLANYCHSWYNWNLGSEWMCVCQLMWSSFTNKPSLQPSFVRLLCRNIPWAKLWFWLCDFSSGACSIDCRQQLTTADNHPNYLLLFELEQKQRWHSCAVVILKD